LWISRREDDFWLLEAAVPGLRVAKLMGNGFEEVAAPNAN
jgi:hypothetical protein